VDRLLEDGLGFVDLELGLELGHVRKAAAVGAAAGVGEAEALVDNIVAKGAP
jgi:hypothetical protein